MRDEIRERIEAYRHGEVPNGYKRVEGYTVPVEWEVTSFDSLFERSTRKNDTGCENVLTISAQMGLVSQKDYYEKDIASEDKSGYFLLKSGDYAYNKSYSTGYPYGAIKQLVEYDEGIVSPLYICFTSKTGTNTSFYSQYFEGGMYNREIYRFAQEGARNHGLLNIPVDNFFIGTLIAPSQVEQRRIAEILDMYDHAIRLRRELIEAKRKQKRGLMERLLSPQDENDAMNGWKTMTFQEVCRFINGRAYKQDELLMKGKYPVLRVGNLFTKDEWYYSDLELPEHQYIENGDLIYAWSASFGPQIWRGEKVIYHYHIWKVIPACVILKEYLYQYFQYDVQLLTKEQQGGTMSHVTKETMEKRTCRLPSIERQRTIAQILAKVDQSIELSEQELSYWLEKKKALMQLLLTGLVRVNA